MIAPLPTSTFLPVRASDSESTAFAHILLPLMPCSLTKTVAGNVSRLRGSVLIGETVSYLGGRIPWSPNRSSHATSHRVHSYVPCRRLVVSRVRIYPPRLKRSFLRRKVVPCAIQHRGIAANGDAFVVITPSTLVSNHATTTDSHSGAFVASASIPPNGAHIRSAAPTTVRAPVTALASPLAIWRIVNQHSLLLLV